MLRCILIDDEKHYLKIMRKMLEEFCPDVTILEECLNVQEAKSAIDKHKPDLIFLDIEMPDSNGFDLLMQVREINFEIIFTTAYDQYAIKAIKFSALDFLVKPIVAEELQEAVNKAEKKIFLVHQRQRVDTLIHNINYMNDEKRIALPTSNGMEFVSLKDIIRCESENSYTIFYLVNRPKMMVSKTLGEYEDLLSDYHFLRVHQSHLINLRFIKNYVRGEGGVVTMVDNSQIDVSRRKREEFLKRVMEV